MMNELHARFNAVILPVVQRWARANFRDPDCIAECVGLAWKWTKSLADRGKDGTIFPSAIAKYAVRAVRSGRRVCGQLPTKDAMSITAWRRNGFTVVHFPEHDTFASEGNPFEVAMADHRNAPVAEHAAFRIDWPRFLGQQSERDQRMAEQLAQGEQAAKVARELGVAPCRVTQLRQRMMRRWADFHGQD